MAQLEKDLTLLSLGSKFNPQEPRGKACNPSSGKGGLAGPWSLLASLAQLASFRFTETPCLTKTDWRTIEEDTQH